MSIIYPVGDGTREDFERKFYVAFGFEEKTNYGYHEGADINLKTGGDSDLGVPIHAIADWELTYYHLKSHLESGFGEHLVYKVESPWGTRWIHCCHNQNSIDPQKKAKGKKGDKLAEIGKSGRPRKSLPAHLHMSVFKVDPGTLPNGIDTIAKTKSQLHQYWEDPIKFLREWYDHKDETMDIKQLIIDLRKGLLKKGPSPSEIAWDMDHWTGAEDFIQRITGDGEFYKIYIRPQLESQEKALTTSFEEQIKTLESGCSTEKEQLKQDYHSQLESAKKEYQKNLQKQIEDKDPIELIVLGLNKLVRGWKK